MTAADLLAALAFLALHVCVSACWLAAIKLRPARIAIGPLAVGLAVSWSVVMTAYTLFVIHNPERLASGQICLLYGLFFLLPWRWDHQLAVSLTAPPSRGAARPGAGP